MSGQHNKLQGARAITLSRYRITPEHLTRYQETLQQTLFRIEQDLQQMAADKALLTSIYQTGFSDGYAAAILELTPNNAA